MAAIFYVVIRAGFLTLSQSTSSTGVNEVSLYIVIAFLAGFSIRYSINTLDRLMEVLLRNIQDVKPKKKQIDNATR